MGVTIVFSNSTFVYIRTLTLESTSFETIFTSTLIATSIICANSLIITIIFVECTFVFIVTCIVTITNPSSITLAFIGTVIISTQSICVTSVAIAFVETFVSISTVGTRCSKTNGDIPGFTFTYKTAIIISASSLCVTIVFIQRAFIFIFTVESVTFVTSITNAAMCTIKIGARGVSMTCIWIGVTFINVETVSSVCVIIMITGIALTRVTAIGISAYSVDITFVRMFIRFTFVDINTSQSSSTQIRFISFRTTTLETRCAVIAIRVCRTCMGSICTFINACTSTVCTTTETSSCLTSHLIIQCDNIIIKI